MKSIVSSWLGRRSLTRTHLLLAEKGGEELRERETHGCWQGSGIAVEEDSEEMGRRSLIRWWMSCEVEAE